MTLSPRRVCRPRNRRPAMSLVHEIDYGTPKSKAQKTVTLTIDGLSVTVPEGTSIMRAAMEMGTQIPKLCATDMVDAFGSCRLCLVEIEGRAGHRGQDADRPAKDDPQGRDGALHLGPSARLPDLFGERRLRITGYGRRGRSSRRA